MKQDQNIQEKKDTHIKILLTRDERRRIKTLAYIQDKTLQELFEETIQNLLEKAQEFGI